MNKSYKKLKNHLSKPPRTTFPSLKDLELVRSKIKEIPNKQGEYLRKIHYGCFLLCSEAGLRISEAVKFDLNTKTRKALYRITKPKGKKERYVYIPKKIIRELKKNNWQPLRSNRFAFYHFLQKIKKELGINNNIELTPHTLRRAFTTYHAENGLPLPLLSKLLGHSSIRTTALYWRNIYSEDFSDILTGKKLLEQNLSIFDKNKPSPPKISNPPNQNPNSDIVNNEPAIKIEKPNLPIAEPKPINYQSPTIKEEPPAVTDKPTKREEITRIKELERKLKQLQTENEKLKSENNHLKILLQQDQETETKIEQPLLEKMKN